MKVRWFWLAIVVALVVWLLWPQNDVSPIEDDAALVEESVKSPLLSASLGKASMVAEVSEQKYSSEVVTSQQPICDSVLIDAQAQHREVELPKGLPQEVFRFASGKRGSFKEGLKGISFDRAKEILAACQSWSKELDRALVEQASHVPLSQKSHDEIVALKGACSNIHARAVGQMKLEGIHPRNPDLGSNMGIRHGFRPLLDNGNWEEFIYLVQRGDIPADFRLTLSHDFKMYKNTLVYFALNSNMPERYLRQLIDLGAPIQPSDVAIVATSFSIGPETGLGFYQILIEQGYDLNAVYDQVHLPTLLLRYPYKDERVTDFIERYEFDASKIYFDTEDTLSKAIRIHQEALDQGHPIEFSSLDLLLKNGAQVTPKHAKLAKHERLQGFLKEYECVVLSD